MKNNTYMETVNSECTPSADTLHFHIKNKIDNIEVIHRNFIEFIRKQIKELRGKK
jgi:hypothetical protein